MSIKFINVSVYKVYSEKYSGEIKEFLSKAEECILQFYDFSESGIAPSEEMYPSIKSISNNLDGFYELYSRLSNSIELANKISFTHNNLITWNEFVFQLEEVEGIVENSSELAQLFCCSVSKTVSIVEYWCAAKWLDGESNFSSVCDQLNHTCVLLCKNLQSDFYPMVFELTLNVKKYVTLLSKRI